MQVAVVGVLPGWVQLHPLTTPRPRPGYAPAAPRSRRDHEPGVRRAFIPSVRLGGPPPFTGKAALSHEPATSRSIHPATIHPSGPSGRGCGTRSPARRGTKCPGAGQSRPSLSRSAALCSPRDAAVARIAHSSGSSSSSGSSTNAATATSAAAFGGMNGLVAACKKEGTLNVITLPANWANYGAIMKDFTAKYGIKINDANPDGSSQDEINAMQQLKGPEPRPRRAGHGHLLRDQGGPGRPARPVQGDHLDGHPGQHQGRPTPTWYDDYGGYVAIGYDSAKVKVAPTSFKDLLKPIYKNQVAINGNPTQASAAFSAVYASALANGLAGQHRARHPVLQEAAPGRQLRAGHRGPDHRAERAHSHRDLVGLPARLRDLECGSHVQDRDPDRCALRRLLQPGDQQDGSQPGLRQALGGVPELHHRPEPLLQGKARPIELQSLVSAGTVDKAADAALPAAPAGG